MGNRVKVIRSDCGEGENPFGRAFVEKRGILGENEIKLGENEGGFLGGWPSHRNTVNLAAMPAAER